MRWFRRSTTREVTLYGKEGCHLCEDAEGIVRRLERRYPIHLVKIDITSDPALYRAYDVRIPVISVDGGAELEAPIDERALRRALSRTRK